MKITVYTDGGCSGNPGAGGWAYVIQNNGTESEGSGGEAHTTNNRMELTAVIRALQGLIPLNDGEEVHLHTDSQYVQKGITQWINNWERNGWMTAGKKPVKNKDLWQDLRRLEQTMPVTWHWVKGHAGIDLNERCDDLVQQEIRKVKSGS